MSVETGDLLGHVWVGMRVVHSSLLVYLVESIHVGLLGSHIFLESLWTFENDSGDK